MFPIHLHLLLTSAIYIFTKVVQKKDKCNKKAVG